MIPHRTTGGSDEHAHARSFVGCIEATPQLECLSKRVDRDMGIFFGDSNCSVDLRDDRTQRVGVEHVRPFVEFIACSSRLFDISDREHDLKVGRQEARALQPIARCIHESSNNRSGGVDTTLRQPQQRKTRLRLPSQVTRRTIGILGLSCGE